MAEKKPKRQPTGDYAVGFARPPVANRFKKGEPSPNPKGRPRKAVLTSEEMVQDILRARSMKEVITLADGRTIVDLEAHVRKLRQSHLKDGKISALNEYLSLLSHYRVLVPERLQDKPLEDGLAADHQAIVNQYVGRLMAAQTPDRAAIPVLAPPELLGGDGA